MVGYYRCVLSLIACPIMNSSQATTVVLLLASIFVTSTLVATAPASTIPVPVRSATYSTVDASTMSQISRAQASMVLSKSPRVASVVLFSF